jgi:hypothetical protein
MIPAYFHTEAEARRAEASLPMGMDGDTPVMVEPWHGRPWVIEVDVDPTDKNAFSVALQVINRYGGEFHQGLTTRPGGAPFMNGLPQSVLDRFEAEHPEQHS